jgi:UDP-N-acetyl-D-glucosamine dehydrogenase
VAFHDPYVEAVTIGGVPLASVAPEPATVGGFDAVVLLTVHPEIDVHAIVRAATLVFDARGATVGIDEPHVDRL